MPENTKTLEKQYRVPKQQAECFNLTRTVHISRIEIVPKNKELKKKEYWTYKVNEVNRFGHNHYTIYYSYNLLALEAHRAEMVAHYQRLNEALYKGSSSQGFRINPTLMQAIKAKSDEKIR